MFKKNKFNIGVGLIFLAGLGLNFGLKKYIDNPKEQSKLEQVVSKQQNYRVVKDKIVRIKPNEDLQKVFDDYKTDDFSNYGDIGSVAIGLLGECEGCKRIEKICIAHTMKNRAEDGQKWNGETLKEAIFKPYQYSCFNKWLIEKVLVKKNGKVVMKNGKPLTKKIKRKNWRLKKLKDPMNYNPREFEKNLIFAEEFLAGKYPDPTNGAISYYNPKRIATPKWAKKMEEVYCGPGVHHLYFKDKPL